MSPDRLDPDHFTMQVVSSLFNPVVSVVLGIFVLLPACIGLILTVVAVRKKRLKHPWYLAILAILAVAAVAALLINDGVRYMQDWDPKPPAAVENAEAVQEWATSSYGVSVEDRQAKSMAGEILGKTTRTQTYTVQGPAGVLEVKLTATEDGNFHMVQTAAELPLARIGD